MTMTPADPGCVDCGWHPASGERWPSEGRAAVRWIESLLICAEGDWFGKPIRLRKSQKRRVWKWYEFCPQCGYWHYDQALWGEATGGGKTTLVAAIECLELFGPPQIAPVSPNIINAAASFEQADILFSIAATMLGGRDQMIKEAPLCGYAEVYDTEIRRADGQPGVMRRVAAVAGTNEGGLPSLFAGDEFHEWGELGSTKARVHMVIGKSTKKRRMICRVPLADGQEYGGPGEIITKGDGGRYVEIPRGPGRILNITTAGFDVEHSIAGAVYLQGKRAEMRPEVAPRLYFDWPEGEDGDYSDPAVRRRAVMAASDAAGVLWDVEARVREWDKPEVEHHEWIRYYANRWVPVSQESWLRDHPGAYAKCRGTWELSGAEPCMMAIDMALKRDSVSVRRGWKLDDGRIATVNRTWYPADGKIDHLEVFDWIRAQARAMGDQFMGLMYDPRFFELPARMLEEEGFVVIEFSQTPAQMAPACGMAFDMIIRQQIVHPGDPDDERQVNAAVKRQQETGGFTLSKPRSRIHIDGAVTLAMLVDGLERLAPAVAWEDTVW